MTLTYRAWGDAPPSVLLLHGMLGSADNWWRVAPMLAAALPSLTPERAVLVDSPFIKQGAHDADEARAHYAGSVAARTSEGLRARRPFSSSATWRWRPPCAPGD